VGAGETLWRIEGRKVMNRMEGRVAGVVRKRRAADGGRVEVGQRLVVRDG